MANQIGDNNERNNCLKLFLEDCFNILYDTSIMVDNRMERMIIENRDLFTSLPIEQRQLVVDSLNDIMNYNQDFNKIGKYYLIQNEQLINRKNLAERIINDFKYKYYNALFFSGIKLLFILFQLYLSISNVNIKNEYNDSEKGANDKKYCINPNIKFKIFRQEINIILFLKLIYFYFYDVAYIIHDFYFYKI